MSTLKYICVFCGSSDGKDPLITRAAIELGRAMVSHNMHLVYGGAKIGVMGTIAQTVIDGGQDVIGIIPSFLKSKEVLHPNLTEIHTTKNMNDRKLQMLEKSDGFITLPGGFGTLEELFEIATGLQLGQHKKPIGLLNINGFYDELLASLQKMVRLGFVKQHNLDLMLVDTTVEGLLAKMHDFEAPDEVLW
ncbi:TIGR00730 family Rossman fold protein [Patiriisocius marinus]|uniref:Cytokinin riboside 5'-monophosphate phosphoribohydrolase n=1 Tax=Patiriisocius marinus TaxID=1397112 RepID=A0A5J4J1T4_9FLAO|nr:TIGR00730 family Rossman fold protein [Patiriisocius marinus]GER60852.1 cytokinin riboside 5'-monophosphate phosphoribohydrolase [Patiriisocius marinus]